MAIKHSIRNSCLLITFLDRTHKHQLWDFFNSHRHYHHLFSGTWIASGKGIYRQLSSSALTLLRVFPDHGDSEHRWDGDERASENAQKEQWRTGLSCSRKNCDSGSACKADEEYANARSDWLSGHLQVLVLRHPSYLR
jgi:hypothetical protein